jgi:hypothetical protein
MGASLKELNEDVYASGIEALSDVAAPKSTVTDDPAP